MNIGQSYLTKFTHVTDNGDPGIYFDSAVTKATTNKKILEAPVHEDVRGRIMRANFKGAKFNIIETKQGFMRSGDLHKSTQFDWLLSGKVELWTLIDGETKKKIIKPSTFIIIKPHVPHLFRFLEDSVMIEQWDKPFDAWFYKPYRRLIDQQFQELIAKPVSDCCLD